MLRLEKETVTMTSYQSDPASYIWSYVTAGHWSELNNTISSLCKSNVDGHIFASEQHVPVNRGALVHDLSI